MGRVILESKYGDALYVLERFYAAPKGQEQTWKNSTEFIVGQLVKFKSYRWAEQKGFYITFIANGTEYEATQDYFITQSAWSDLLRVFGNTEKEIKPAAPQVDNYGWVGIVLGLLAFAAVIWICAGLLSLGG